MVTLYYLPDAAALCVVVEHAVLVVPDDVLWPLTDDPLDAAGQLDGAAALVELLRHRRLTLVQNLDPGRCKRRRNIE